jgi:predicted alpha/beta hydrolase family esterase
MTTTTRILTLPGWQDSGPAHWQTRWDALHGHERVQQADWEWPRRGDWMARLDEVVQADIRPVAFVAHSLGCHLVAAWAAHSRHAGRVRGALLVAPPDLDGLGDALPPQLHGWRPTVRERLPFPAIAVLSGNDPFGRLPATQALAEAWGAAVVHAGERGHLNGESGLGDWPEGHALLGQLLDDQAAAHAAGIVAR